MAKRAPKSSSFSHDTAASADGMAMADDMSHAKICLQRLAEGEFAGDTTVQRALYQSALISFRRCIGADARSMRGDADGGGVVGSLGRGGLAAALGESQAVIAKDLYELADQHVAHRQHLEGLRGVRADVDLEGKNRMVGVWNIPSPARLKQFAKVTEGLHHYFLQQTAVAMAADR